LAVEQSAGGSQELPPALCSFPANRSPRSPPRPGKLADIVVLDGNPLEDIRNSNTVRFVMKNGRLYDGDTLDEIAPRPRRNGPFYWADYEPTGVRAGERR
jgi:hypothetical protein